MPNIQFSVLIKWVKYVTISFLIECIWHKSVPFSSHCCYLSSVLTRSTVKPRWDPLLQLFLQFQQKSSSFQNRLNHSVNGLLSLFLLSDEPQTPNRSIKACLKIWYFSTLFRISLLLRPFLNLMIQHHLFLSEKATYYPISISSSQSKQIHAFFVPIHSTLSIPPKYHLPCY